MVHHRTVPGSSEEWDQLDHDVPEYSVEDTTTLPKRTATAVNIRPGDIVIAVMGITGSGKSTSTVGIYECAYNAKTKIFFIDTPGFDDTYKSDTDILREIADWLSQAYGNHIRLTGIVYLHRILDVRLGNSAMKNLRMFKKLCGDDALQSVVLATTWWSGVDLTTGAQRERELATRDSFWAGMIAKGSRMFRQDQGPQSARQIVDYLVDRKRPVTLKIQEELVDQNKTLDLTGAGLEVDAQLAAQKREFEAQLQRIQTDMRQAMKEKDHEYQQELLAFKQETEQSMKQAEEDRRRLQRDQETLRRERDAELAEEKMRIMRKMQENNKKIMENEHELKMMQLNHASDLAKQQLAFEVEKERAERQRLAQILKEKEDGGCTVM